MNCGVSCHKRNPAAGASFTGLELKLASGAGASPAQTPALRTTLNRPTTVARYRDPTMPKIRIIPGRPSASAVYARVSSRVPAVAMPPLGTHLVDRANAALLERWIAEMGPAEQGGESTPENAAAGTIKVPGH